ncbi:hypothetical protein CB1_000159024 [Camelus ferus]|nr:hypothetical protein CB1_000159024 [Camelus ferus]
MLSGAGILHLEKLGVFQSVEFLLPRRDEDRRDGPRGDLSEEAGCHAVSSDDEEQTAFTAPAPPDARAVGTTPTRGEEACWGTRVGRPPEGSLSLGGWSEDRSPDRKVERHSRLFFIPGEFLD